MRTLFLAINVLVVGTLIALFVGSIFWDVPREYLQSFIGENIVLTIGVLILLTFLATFVAPLTTVLVVPTAAGFIGPLPAALAGWLGWFLGSVAAFWVSRKFGKPLLRRFVKEETLSLFERYIPVELNFLTLVVMRMAIAPDIVSYGLGLFSTVSWRLFVTSALVGLLPFALIGAYAGGALLSGNWYALSIFVGVGVLLYIVVVRSFGHGIHRRNTDTS